ncbi:MAG TPA: cupredoxin domain-containing protein [Nocardioides sp.]|jgi:plastocyanin|nr:cupredoxin domain-containing protein [Nocardioides sp.]
MPSTTRLAGLLVASAALTTGVVGTAATAHALSTPTGHHAQAASRTAPAIRISNFAFHTPKSVQPGATVRIVNHDGTTHTVTSNKGLFNVRIPAGQTRTITAPHRAGTYRFHCNIHTEMHGRLRVS